MDASIVFPLIEALQALSAESLSLLLLLIACGAIIFMFRFFGIHGLYAYSIIAVVAANIQVLKLTHFRLFAEPLALGTIAFATTYLVSDILTELYGKETAKRGVWVCFSAQILLTIFMIITLGFQPAVGDTGHEAMLTLFTPSLRLFVASLIAFTVSQLLDIWSFQRLRDITGSRLLWLRTVTSFLISGFVDNFLFSILAWNLLSPTPIGFQELCQRYVLGTYIARVLVALISIPTIYYCRSIKTYSPSALLPRVA